MPKELALACITTMAESNAWLRDTYISAHNARFAIKAEQEGSAFVAVPGLDLAEVMCVQEERVVGNDNCVSFFNRKLQIPESPLRPHFVEATVKVHQYPDGVGWRFSMAAVALAATTAKAFQSANLAPPTATGRPPARPAVGLAPCSGLPRYASRRDAVTSPLARPSLTAPPRVARSHARSAPGNGLT